MLLLSPRKGVTSREIVAARRGTTRRGALNHGEPARALPPLGRQFAVLSAMSARFMITGHTYHWTERISLYLKWGGMHSGLVGQLLNSHRPQASRLKPPEAKREVEVKAEVEQGGKKNG